MALRRRPGVLPGPGPLTLVVRHSHPPLLSSWGAFRHPQDRSYSLPETAGTGSGPRPVGSRQLPGDVLDGAELGLGDLLAGRDREPRTPVTHRPAASDARRLAAGWSTTRLPPGEVGPGAMTRGIARPADRPRERLPVHRPRAAFRAIRVQRGDGARRQPPAEMPIGPS
jgi:hypothetical protein